MARPFIVVGAMKSGTTTLETVLRGLEGVELVGEKESSSFLKPERAQSVVERIRSSAALAAGEVSTAYMQRPLYEVDTKSVASLLGPELVVMAVLRDPLGRAVSHWRHWAQLGMNTHPDLRAALLDPDAPHVTFSRYYHQLDPWVEAVGQERVFPLRLEDFARDPAAWVGEVCRALGVPVPVQVSEVHENAADTRVVARGAGRLIMNSPAYRRIVRPLTPPAVRRLGTLLLGGHMGGHEAETPTPETQEAFRELISRDSVELARRWPSLVWD